MGEVIQLDKYKVEKQYQAESMCINLALDNVSQTKLHKDFAKEYQYAFMKLYTDNLNRRG